MAKTPIITDQSPIHLPHIYLMKSSFYRFSSKSRLRTVHQFCLDCVHINFLVCGNLVQVFVPVCKTQFWRIPKNISKLSFHVICCITRHNQPILFTAVLARAKSFIFTCSLNPFITDKKKSKVCQRWVIFDKFCNSNRLSDWSLTSKMTGWGACPHGWDTDIIT